MHIVKFNPLQELQNVERDMNKLWQNSWGLLPAFGDSSALDMYEEKGKLVTEISLPNFKKEEIKVTTESNVLEITAKHEESKESSSKRRYFLRESSSQYVRRITLPEGVNIDKADVNFKDGLLKVSMPFKAPQSSKELPVK